MGVDAKWFARATQLARTKKTPPKRGRIGYLDPGHLGQSFGVNCT